MGKKRCLEGDKINLNDCKDHLIKFDKNRISING